MKKTAVFFCLLLALLLVGTQPRAAMPAEYPNRAITMLVGYEPGGALDAIIRIISGYLTEELGQPVVVESLPGAANMLQLNALASRTADGYTLGSCSAGDSPWAFTGLAAAPLPWKTDDFLILGRMSAAPSSLGLIVNAQKWETLTEFIAAVRAAPPKTFSVGINGPGRLEDPIYAEFQKLLGIEFNTVYYTSSNSIQTDVLTGDLDAGVLGCNRANFVNNSSFRVLALFGDSVPDDFPVQGLPFLADYEQELGFKWSDANYLKIENGGATILANAKTDPQIVETLKAALKKVSEIPEYQEKMRMATYPFYTSPETALEAHRTIQAALEEAKTPQE